MARTAIQGHVFLYRAWEISRAVGSEVHIPLVMLSQLDLSVNELKYMWSVKPDFQLQRKSSAAQSSVECSTYIPRSYVRVSDR